VDFYLLSLLRNALYSPHYFDYSIESAKKDFLIF
jgi:hypothetical protein